MGKLEDVEGNVDAQSQTLIDLASAVNTIEDELKTAVAQGLADAATVDRILNKTSASRAKAAEILADAQSRTDDDPPPPPPAP